MPGIFCHLAFAEDLYRRISSSMPIDKTNFVSGNLIPDLAVADKKFSHYRKKASIDGLFIPNMDIVEKELFIPNDSIKLGIFCHLYLDYYFIEEFLIPEFVWDASRMKILNPRSHMEWDPKPFFMKDGIYYRGYNEINHLLVRDKCVSVETISELPEMLPNTGIEVFDVRREKTWKVELEENMLKKEVYTGNIFDYNRLRTCIEKASIHLTKKINSKID